jgi:ribosomal-protein-alanine N-acetyltransferase
MTVPAEISVSLRAFTEKCLTDRYVAWLNDPEVMRFSERRRGTHTIESCREYLQEVTAMGNWFRSIHVSGAGLQGEHVGNITVYFDQPNLTADIAILIGDKRAWGLGIGSRAFAAVIDEVWLKSDAQKITTGTLSVNAPMLRIMEKSRMAPDGVRVRQALWNGQRVDIVHRALFRAGAEGGSS